ncbi:MAG: hypothetical protein CME64_06800 [Halobacteriovoraceae bacterium]|nr:hypothetical protein [Halobacteriovoraceae bacterium]|tara:strand:+ start:18320 stop:18853 length:534 start_codon:yes stop_codon:yes gene_type:complete
MNKYGPKEILLGTIKTCLLLIVLEIFTTAFLPAMGIINFRPEFNVLIVLFLAFKLETPVLAWLIMIVQYVHSLFSIEGWAIGAFTGVLVSMSVRYLKDMLDFSTAISTIIVVQIFQVAWFVATSFLLSLKLGDFGNFFHLFWQDIPESLALSILSPFFFFVLDRVWRVKSKAVGVAI